jgi:cyclopropane fatty-acyl-phospholipid synthase-like methyltransferase
MADVNLKKFAHVLHKRYSDFINIMHEVLKDGHNLRLRQLVAKYHSQLVK